MIRSVSWSFALAGLFTAPTMADAQIIAFRWADLSDTFATDFGNVPVGGQVSLHLWVEQSGGNPLGSDGGMFTYSARVRYDNPFGSTVPSTTSAILNGGVAPSTFGADFTPNVPPGGSATLNGSNAYSKVFNIGSSFSSGVQPDANGRILLGTVRFTALSPGAFNFRAEDPNPSAAGDFSTFTNLNSLDGQLQNGSALFTVVPVPEPSSLALAGTAVAAIWHVRRRRWYSA
jgi:hypothetical protein